ncbi:MAG: hypothetical protein AAGB16_03360 [Pseudomonadota bacterium]
MTQSLKTLTASLFSIAMIGSAMAGEWKVGNLTPDGEAPKSELDGLYVLAEKAEGPTILLGCSDRLGVQAKIYLKGMTQDALALQEARNVRTRMVEIDTESTDPKKDVWAYMRAKGQLISVRPWQGRRIFNAVVKNEVVNLDILKIGELSVELPEINEAFTTFASICTATAPKQANVDSEES